MSNRSYNLRTVCGLILTTALVASSARADITVGRNLAFNAGGKNPWRPGNAYVWDPEPYTLLDVKNAHVDLPPINANPTDALLDIFGSVLGVEIPDFGLVSMKVGGTVSGNAYVGFDLYADAGRLAINYPGHADLNLQTNPGTSQVTTRQPYSIGGSFQPGLNVAYQIPEAVRIGLYAGEGYAGPPQIWGTIDHTSYSQPTFSTYRPDFNAQLIATADVHAGVYGSASALWGRFKARKNFTFDADVGGTIIEVDPSGLYVFGEDQGVFDLTQPIDIPIQGVGTARVALPLPAVNGAPNIPNSTVLHGTYEGEILRLDTDVEKLVPVIGSILHNSIPPLITPYDLAHIGLAPKLSLYQDLTFTPDTRVKLTFSEIVRVGASLTNVVEFPLGQTINWTPIFSNSDDITIVPEYIMRNSFRHETGLALDVDVTFDALGFDSPLLPEYVGPLVHETSTFEIGRLPLYEPDPWEIEMNSVVGSGIPVTKYNADFAHDVLLTSANLISGGANIPSTFELHFQRSFAGEPPHQFQTTVTGFYSKLDVEDPGGGEPYLVHVFTSDSDVVFTDPVTSEQFNLGRDFGLFDSTDLSALVPGPSPVLLVEDPNNPGQNLPPLSIPFLEEIPYTPPDIENDPVLGAPTLDQTSDTTQVEYSPDVLDTLQGPVTTVIVQSIDLVPDGDAQFGPLPKVSINNSGDVAVQGSLDPFADAAGSDVPAIYLAVEEERLKLVREGDEIPGGGTVELGSAPFSKVSRVSDLGIIAFHANGSDPDQRGVYLGTTNGVTQVARHGQAIPDGNSYFNFSETEIPVAINGTDDAAFATGFSSTPGGAQTGFGVFRGDGVSTVEIARVGQTAPNGQPFTQLHDNVDINDSGDVAFHASTTPGGTNPIVYRGNGQSLTAMYTLNGPGPFGSTMGTSIETLAPRINSAGQVAFAAYLNAGGFAYGIFRGDGGPLSQIVRTGLTAPDMDGTMTAIDGAIQFDLNDAGQVAFVGYVSGAANYGAVFRGDGTDLRSVARQGQAAPDGDGTFQSFYNINFENEVEINNHGHIAFISTLANTSNFFGIFVHDGTNLVQVARTGQSLAGSTITSLGQPSLNDEMQVAYTAQLADGRQVAARFEPRLYWINPGSGNWSTAANWSLNIEPSNPYDVVIGAENPLTVTGPAVNRTVKSILLAGHSAASARLHLTSGVTLTATNGASILANGILSGDGTLAGDVTNAGTITPGNALGAGAIHVAGNFSQDAAGTLSIAIGSPTVVPKLDVTGDIALGGKLIAGFVDHDGDGNIYDPVLGDSFDVLDWSGTLGGAFNSLQLPALDPDLMWNVSQLHTTGVFSVALAGDFNLDGAVDAADYVYWRKTGGPLSDYITWRTNFGRSFSGGGSNASSPAAPEPVAVVLLSIAAALGTAVRRTGK